jgi:D-3-phosphoglycerate dehydrogenase
VRERVLVVNSPTGCDLEQELLPAYRVELADPERLPEHAPDVVGLLIDEFPVSGAVMDRFPALRCISIYGVGVDWVDHEEAARRGIAVRNVPDETTEEVATHAIALLLALVRRLPGQMRETAAGGWSSEAAGPLRRLSSLTVGILGFGRIGRAFAERARGFGCRLVAWDPYVEEAAFAELGVARLEEVDDLLAEADAVSVHLPLTDGTEGLLDEARLARLREGALLVNTSRGGVLDTQAVIDLLRAGRLGGAALDVLRREPPGPDELAVLEAGPNVIVTPHVAYASDEGVHAVRVRVCRNFLEAVA